MPLIGIRSNSDAAKAGPVLDQVSGQLSAAGAPFALHHAEAGNGYAAALEPGATPSSWPPAAASVTRPAFKAAVPDAAVGQPW